MIEWEPNKNDANLNIPVDGQVASICWNEQTKLLTMSLAYSAVYGMGERYNGLNQNDRIVKIEVEEKFCNQGDKSYCPSPFFFTDTWFSFCTLSGGTLIFDFTQKNVITVHVPSNCKFIFNAGAPEKLISEYMSLSGPAILPPDWVFGPWISANHWNTQKETEKQIELLKKYQFPATVLVLEAWSDEATFPFAMSGHTNLMDADRLPDFIMNMRLAHFFGCKYIVSSIGEAHLKDKAKTGNEVLVQNIKGLIPHLKENGLMLVLELHGEHATGTIMNEIVTAVNSNLVKINYDTANCVFYGNVDAADDIDTCMDNVAYLHIKDKAGARDAWDFPALGKGYVDFKTLFNKLDKANNDAPLSLEIEFTAKGPKDLDEINTAVKESAAYLENLGYKI